jgi:hypothetical protein
MKKVPLFYKKSFTISWKPPSITLTGVGKAAEKCTGFGGIPQVDDLVVELTNPRHDWAVLWPNGMPVCSLSRFH